MASVLRPIGHEERLSIVDHLDELRTRLIVCGVALAIAFALCFWQNHALLSVLNRALPHTPTTTSQHGLRNIPTETVREERGLSKAAAAAATLSASPDLSPIDRQHFAQLAQGAREAASALPKSAPTQEKPITI